MMLTDEMVWFLIGLNRTIRRRPRNIVSRYLAGDLRDYSVMWRLSYVHEETSQRRPPDYLRATAQAVLRHSL
jgi:hypothetical protein